MQTFDVYHSANASTVDNYEAIKQGFSWPAFFFAGIWSLVKGLYSRFWMALGIGIFLIMLDSPAGWNSQGPVTVLGGIALGVYFGFNGNEWRRDRMARNKWTHIATIAAASPSAAIQEIRQNPEAGTRPAPSQSIPPVGEVASAAVGRIACLQCAELILPQASLCRFCNTKLPENWGRPS